MKPSDETRTNRLIHERSPYLLQHARNPVDWLPWGDEAFARARAEDKPVFLSIGYSACHWCHVMERESFEDEAVAQVLNEHFVPVKVDREERPDVDHVYQLAYQLIAQRAGGWPLSMFLTPDREPFFGGTYFPDHPRHGMPSFRQVLERVSGVWRERRGAVTQQASELTQAILEATRARSRPDDAVTSWLDDAARTALARADRAQGGFGRAPKFPNTMTHEVLLAAAAFGLAGVADDARAVVATSLDAMSRGGIRDHLGGGYARYSTDAQWRIPHFEKMLYDNALLARLHLDLARLLAFFPGASDPIDAARCRAEIDAITSWLAREMTSPEGAFYSAQDADSEGEEGRFFVWTPTEIAEAVGPDDALAVCAWFDVTDAGNFEHGRSALWTPRGAAQVADALGVTQDALRGAVARAVPKLFAARARRAAPLTDDKCLVGWNALMIGALADAGATLGRADLLTAARRALDAWRTRGWRDGRLAHAMRSGEAYGTGFLDDYAGLARAAIDLWEADFDPADLAFARALADVLLDRFYDPADATLFFSPSDGEVILHRGADPFDHAHPGGTGLALDALLRLAAITGEARYADAARAAVRRYGPAAREHVMGMGSVVLAADRAARGEIEVIVMGDRGRDDTRAMLRAARAAPLPHRVLVCARSEAEGVAAGVDPALLAHRSAGPEGAPVAFVCRGATCEMPARSPEALVETLRRVLRA